MARRTIFGARGVLREDDPRRPRGRRRAAPRALRSVACNGCATPASIDALIALALGDGARSCSSRSATTTATRALNVAGGAAPHAAARRAPALRRSRSRCTFSATAALTSILGGGLFVGEPPPFACLVAGAVTFYSLGAHADDRAAQVGAALGVAGLWISVIGSDHSDVRASCSPAA